MLRPRLTLALLLLCLGLTACAAQVEQKENLLTAAGFNLIPANTPQRQAALASMPPHKFIHQVRNGQVVFSYADPTICRCLYVGDQRAYQLYQQAVFAKNLANEQEMTAEMNQMNAYQWGMWGY